MVISYCEAMAFYMLKSTLRIWARKGFQREVSDRKEEDAVMSLCEIAGFERASPTTGLTYAPML